MVYVSDLRDRMKLLLTEIICQICTKEVPHKYQIHIEGTVCVTSDTHPAFAIQIAQLLSKAADVSNLRGVSKSFQPVGGYTGPATLTDSRGLGPVGPLSGGSNHPLSPPIIDTAGGEQLCSPSLLTKSIVSGPLGTRSVVEPLEMSSGEGRDTHLRRALFTRHDSELSEPVDMRGVGPTEGKLQSESVEKTSDVHSLEPMCATVKRKLSNIDDPEEIIKNVQRSARQILRKVSVTENQCLTTSPPDEGCRIDLKCTLPPGSAKLGVAASSGVAEVKEPHDPHRDGPLRKRNKLEYCREAHIPRHETFTVSLDSKKSTSVDDKFGKGHTADPSPYPERELPEKHLKSVHATEASNCGDVAKDDDVESLQQDNASVDGGEIREEKQESSNNPRGPFTVKDKVRNLIFQREKSVERLRTSSTGSSSVIRDILQSSNTPSTPSSLGILIPNFPTPGNLQRSQSSERIGLMRQSSTDANLNASKQELHLDVSTPTQSLPGPLNFKLKDQKTELILSPSPVLSPVIKLGQHVSSSFNEYLSQPGSGNLPVVPGAKPVFTAGSSTPVMMDYVRQQVQRPTVLPLQLTAAPSDAKDTEIIGEPKVRIPGGQILPQSPASTLSSSDGAVNYSSAPYKDSAAGYKMLAWQMKNTPLTQLGLKPDTNVTSGQPATPGSSDSKCSPGEVSDIVKSIMDTEKVKQFNLGHLSKEAINGLIIVDHDSQKCISPQDYVYKDEAGETQVRACEYCGKHFKYFSKLMEHIRSHTKQKPYKCSICSRTYTYKGDLTVHIRQHSTSKPYVCDCGRSFASKKYLSVHQSQARIKGRHAISKDERHAQYECSQCGKRFKFFSSFDLHLQTHQTPGVTPGDQLEMFECQSCNCLFKDHSLFVEHVLEHENGEHPKIKYEVEDDDYEDCGELDEEGNSSIEDKDTPEGKSDTKPPKGRCQTYRVIQPVIGENEGELTPNLSEFRPLVMGKTIAPKAVLDKVGAPKVMVESIPDGKSPAIVSKPEEEEVNLSEQTPGSAPTSEAREATVVRSVSQPLGVQLSVPSTPPVVLPATLATHQSSELPGVPQSIHVPASSPFTLSSLPQTLASLPVTLTSLPQAVTSLGQTSVSSQPLSSLPQPLASPVSCQPLYASAISQLTGLQAPTLQGISGQTLQLHTLQPHGVQVLSVQPLHHPSIHQIPFSVSIPTPVKVTTAPAAASTPLTISVPSQSSPGSIPAGTEPVALVRTEPETVPPVENDSTGNRGLPPKK